jgi:hypothetical protein
MLQQPSRRSHKDVHAPDPLLFVFDVFASDDQTSREVMEVGE